MAGNRLSLKTEDAIVVSTSRGNQEKWYVPEEDTWYKLDGHGFESLAEAVASRILRKYSNVEDLGIPVAQYDVARMQVHGALRTVSKSKNFKKPDESIVTAYTILKNGLGPDFLKKFSDQKTLKGRVQLLVATMKDATGLDDFGEYLTLLIEIDSLILNQDRHLNNIAVLRTSDGYKYCPIFDNGAAFLLDSGLYPYDVATKAFVPQAVSLPFKVSFSAMLRTMHTLYPPQLVVRYGKHEVDDAVAPYIPFYPEPFRPYLCERVKDVLLIRKSNRI